MSMINLKTLQSEQVPFPLSYWHQSSVTAEVVPKKSEHENNQPHTNARVQKVMVNRKANYLSVYLQMNIKH